MPSRPADEARLAVCAARTSQPALLVLPPPAAGMAASVLLADSVYDVSCNVILDSAMRAISAWDVVTSMIKCWVFGTIIATGACPGAARVCAAWPGGSPHGQLLRPCNAGRGLCLARLLAPLQRLHFKTPLFRLLLLTPCLHPLCLQSAAPGATPPRGVPRGWASPPPRRWSSPWSSSSCSTLRCPSCSSRARATP